MTRWLRLLALASVLSIGQSCGLRPVELPRIDPHGALPAGQARAADPAGVDRQGSLARAR